MSRETALNNWLIKTLGTTEFKTVPLAGDCSFRKYYRIHIKNNSYVVMDAPPPEMPATFVEVAAILQEHHVQVPEISAFDADNGFILLSDFGDRLYLKELTHHSASELYGEAIETLLKIQQCQGKVPNFDKAFMKRQLNVFKDWYLEKYLNLKPDSEELTRMLRPLASLADKLFKTIEAQPVVFVHQDYHSRNLMVLKQGGPGILDFQDAVRGPITYDLVSLFQDAYVTWPRSQVEAWVAEYQEKAQQQGILSKEISQSEFLRWMDLTGLQRHLKNLGVFARKYYRDGTEQYLKDIPTLQGYIKEAFERYNELQDYAAFFETVLSQKELQACER